MFKNISEKDYYFFNSSKSQILIFVSFIITLLLWTLCVFFSPWNPDYTAGEIYDHYLAWTENNTLYPTINVEPFRVLNYPPLYFYSVKFLAGICAIPPLIAGRIISFLSVVLSFITLFSWCKKFGLSKNERIGLIGLCVTSFPILYPIPQFHLQWEAIALSFFGLYCINSGKILSILAGAVIMSFACFTKQTQIITMIIASIYLMMQSPRKSVYFILTFGGMSLFLLIIFYREFGHEMLKHLIIYTIGTFSGKQLLRQIIFYLLPWIGFLIYALWKSVRSTSKRKDVTWYYFVGQSLWLLSSSREGSSYQYFIEWSLSVIIYIAPTLFKKNPIPLVKLLKTQYYLGIIGVSLFLGYFSIYVITVNSSLSEICITLQDSQSLILSDDPGLIRACGHNIGIQPFIFHILNKKGLWDEKVLQDRINNKVYDYALFPFSIETTLETERWSRNILSALRQNYREEKKIRYFSILKPISITK